MLHPNVETKIVDTSIALPRPKVKYRGMHGVIATIAKDQKCSMNKARKFYTMMHKGGYTSIYLASLIDINRNNRVYPENVLKNIRDDMVIIDGKCIFAPTKRFAWTGELKHPT